MLQRGVARTPRIGTVVPAEIMTKDVHERERLPELGVIRVCSVACLKDAVDVRDGLAERVFLLIVRGDVKKWFVSGPVSDALDPEQDRVAAVDTIAAVEVLERAEAEAIYDAGCGAVVEVLPSPLSVCTVFSNENNVRRCAQFGRSWR